VAILQQSEFDDMNLDFCKLRFQYEELASPREGELKVFVSWG